MHEYWDLYDTNRMALGKTHLRGTPLMEGTYHIVVSIWTINRNNKLLLTLRSPDKELLPNLWENTSGSVISGETSLAAARRELREETGIEVNESDIVCLGTTRKASSFVDVFLVHTEREEDTILLQEGETIAYRWVTISDLEMLYEQNMLAFPVSFQFAKKLLTEQTQRT